MDGMIGRARFWFLAGLLLLAAAPARAEKIKTMAEILYAVDRHAEGIGLVTGLNGTGDKSTAALKLVKAYLEANSFNLDLSDLSTNNLALVKVDTTIPAFIRPGQKLDLRVTALGDAKSIENGMLMNCPLRFKPGGEAVAWAAGRVLIGGNTADTAFPTSGRVPANAEGGAQVVAVLPTDFVEADNSFRLVLKRKSFADAATLARAINSDEGTNPFLRVQTGFEQTALGDNQLVARALDAGMVEVRIPDQMNARKVEYVQEVLELDIAVERPARVLVNRATKTVIITGEVRVDPVAISHKNLTVTLRDIPQGADDRRPRYSLENNTGRSVIELDGPGQLPNLQSLIDTLNAMGVSTSDVIVILEKLKSAGALHAELIVE